MKIVIEVTDVTPIKSEAEITAFLHENIEEFGYYTVDTVVNVVFEEDDL